VFLKVLLRKAVERERRNGAFETWSGKAPHAPRAAPAGELVAVDQIKRLLIYLYLFACVWDFELGRDGWNTSTERARKVISCPSSQTMSHGSTDRLRRLTRLTNAFSKKLENLKAAVALHFAWYNFVRVHKNLRVTPAMQSGIANHVWNIAELISA
jgi:hypothetical protein